MSIGRKYYLIYSATAFITNGAMTPRATYYASTATHLYPTFNNHFDLRLTSSTKSPITAATNTACHNHVAALMWLNPDIKQPYDTHMDANAVRKKTRSSLRP